jgi:AcrR family transcriptional regulator
MTSAPLSRPIAQARNTATAEADETKTLSRPSVTAPGSSRERLLEAMVRAVARHGHAGASVSRVVELAGASRATFYEHFSNREECFLAAQRSVAERALGFIEVAGNSDVRLSAALEEVLVRAVENPGATRLLLVECPGSSSAARSEHERFLATVERRIDACLRPDRALQIAVGPLLDGVLGMIAMRLLHGEAATLPRLARGLIVWASSYRLAPGEHRLTERNWVELGRSIPPAEFGKREDVALLPRGRSAATSAETAAIRRERIIDATARIVAEKGFAALTVAEVVAAARVPRNAFYAQFDGKQSAFLAAQNLILRDAMGAAAAEFVLGENWPDRVWRGLKGLLYYIAERPDLARVSVLEAQAAGEEAVLRSQSGCTAFTLFLEEGYRQDPRGAFLPSVTSGAVAFAIQGMMRRTLLRGRADRLPELLPHCAHLALAPFIGPQRSLEFVTVKAREVG